MDRAADSKSSSDQKSARDVILGLLCSRDRKARFMTELYASMDKSGTRAAEVDRALAELERDGAVMVRDHFCADPHLAGVDLRVVTIVDSREDNPQLAAIRRIDSAWNKWLNEYLANHRCG